MTTIEATKRAKDKLARGSALDEFDVANLVEAVYSTAFEDGRLAGLEQVREYTERLKHATP